MCLERQGLLEVGNAGGVREWQQILESFVKIFFAPPKEDDGDEKAQRRTSTRVPLVLVTPRVMRLFRAAGITEFEWFPIRVADDESTRGADRNDEQDGRGGWVYQGNGGVEVQRTRVCHGVGPQVCSGAPTRSASVGAPWRNRRPFVT